MSQCVLLTQGVSAHAARGDGTDSGCVGSGNPPHITSFSSYSFSHLCMLVSTLGSGMCVYDFVLQRKVKKTNKQHLWVFSCVICLSTHASKQPTVVYCGLCCWSRRVLLTRALLIVLFYLTWFFLFQQWVILVLSHVFQNQTIQYVSNPHTQLATTFTLTLTSVVFLQYFDLQLLGCKCN